MATQTSEHHVTLLRHHTTARESMDSRNLAPPSEADEEKTEVSEDANEHEHGFMLSTSSTDIDFGCDWMVKGLGLVAAILFGVWAPLSFFTTKEMDSQNNETQEKLVSSMSALSSIQDAASTAQSKSLSEIVQRFKAIGELQVAQYCNLKVRFRFYRLTKFLFLTLRQVADQVSINKRADDACSAFISKGSVPGLVSYLGNMPSATGPSGDGGFTANTNAGRPSTSSTSVPKTTTATSTQMPTATGGNQPSGHLSTGSFVGIVIGVILAVLLVVGGLGLLAWKRRRESLRRR